MHGRAGRNVLKTNTLVLLCKQVDYQWVSLLSPRGGDKFTGHRAGYAGGMSAGGKCAMYTKWLVYGVHYVLQPALFHGCSTACLSTYIPDTQVVSRSDVMH